MRKSIAFKLSILLILSVVGIFAITTVANIYLFKSEIEGQLESSQNNFKEQISKSLAHPFWNFDFTTIEEICNVFLNNDDLAWIRVTDPEGKIIFQDPVIPPPGKVISKDILLFEKKIGTLDLIASAHQYVVRAKKGIIYSSLFVLLTCLVIFLLVKILLRVYVFNPLQILSDRMMDVSQGAYDQKLGLNRGQELEQIVHSFNKMSHAILLRENKLRQQQEQFQTLFETMHQGVLYMNTDGVITNINPAVTKILKIPAEDLIHSSWPHPGFRYINEDETPIEQTDIPCLKVLQTRQPVKNRIIGIIKKESQAITWISVNAVLSSGVDGNKPYQLYMTIDDVTERLYMQNLMVHTEKMMAVGGLAAGIAHEINNPLGIILQASQNMERRFSFDLKKNHDAAKAIGLDFDKLDLYFKERSIYTYIKNIKEAGLRAADIIRNLLDFSRDRDSRIGECDINTLMDEVIVIASKDYDLKKKYNFKNIEFIRDYGKIDTIRCNRTEISQVLLNLIKNAAQAMAGYHQNKESSRIRIETQSIPNGISIKLEDNGPGITETDKKSIFEPFFSTKPVGEGTGLGLSVSYFIITSHHNGKIKLETTADGGARFVIEIPNQE